MVGKVTAQHCSAKPIPFWLITAKFLPRASLAICYCVAGQCLKPQALRWSHLSQTSHPGLAPVWAFGNVKQILYCRSTSKGAAPLPVTSAPLPRTASFFCWCACFFSCFAHIGGFWILLARSSSFDATWSQEWCRWRFLGKVARWWTTRRWAVLACQGLQQRRYRGMEKEEKREEKTTKGQK